MQKGQVISVVSAGAVETAAFRAELQALVARLGVEVDFLAKRAGLRKAAFTTWLYQTPNQPLAISRPALKRLRDWRNELADAVRQWRCPACDVPVGASA